MAKIKVAKIPSKRINSKDLTAILCYYYPQYTLLQARRLPAKDVVRLIRVARVEKAKEYQNLLQIVAASNTEKGRGVKKLSKHYEDIIKNG